MSKKTYIQVAVDARDLKTAELYTRSAVNAGADWIEAGTPLIVSQGMGAIAKLVEWSAGRPVVADFKAMDGVGKYFQTASEMGAQIAVVLAAAPDASIQAAVTAKQLYGTKVVVDLIGVADKPLRAKQAEAMGADYIMLHLGHDEARGDPSKQVLDGLEEVLAAVSIPVGVSTFTQQDAVRAVRLGATFIVQGEPILSSPNRDTELRRFIDAVRSAS